LSETETDTRTVQEERVEREYKIIGTRQARYDANLKVSGSAVFGTDVHLPGMLYGKIFRSTFTHAKIVKLDVSKAERYPGVRAVVTARDFPEVIYGFAVKDQTFLPKERVVYQGQPVCALAADSVEIAEKALAEIEVEYDPLPNVLSVEEALKDESFPLHPDVVPAGAPPYKSKNVSSYTRIHRGNVKRAFETADFLLEEEYHTQQVHQSYIEPRAATAEFDPITGKIRVWTSTQSPYWVRNSMAEILGIPVSRIQLFPMHTGGGFGAKLSAYLEPFCVMLAKKARHPVRIVMTREEEFLAGTPRPPIHFWIKSAVKDGRITARQGRAVVDTGAFGSEGAVYANIACFALVGPYNIPNIETEGIGVYTNKQPAGAYRAPGTMESAFAVESHVDMLAKKAGIDPLEFRLRNLLEDGDSGPTGQIMNGVGVKDALSRAAERAGYREFRKAERNLGANLKRGIGMAVGLIPSVGIHASAAYIKLNEDGKVILITGTQDTGSGAQTGLAMIAAEELGVNLDDVIIKSGDTDFAPWDGGAQGSRTTFGGGNAVLMAARDAKEQILKAASYVLKVDRDRIMLRDGAAHVVGSNNSIKFSDLVGRTQYDAGGPIVGRGFFVKEFPEYDKNSLEGYFFVPSLHDPTFVAHIAEVEVNLLTGKVRVTRYVAAQDLGRCINPLGAEGQIQGGVTQGIGYALYEEMIHDEGGFTVNPNFGDYKLPTIVDVPMIEPIIVEGHYGSGPYGAKGVGEANIVPPAGAIANAVYDAVGARIRSLPMRPERVLEAMDELVSRAV
jgi:CO/xanthine dehydrogenase Mo-binding subunit